MRTIETCRVCGGQFETVWNLGELYVSDFPLPTEGDGTKAPLELVLCKSCSLLQLKHTVSAETMYRNYWYRSGINQTMCTALADIANKAEELIHLEHGDVVLDIGCNDGTLLQSYNTKAYKIGFDPAKNMKQYSEQVAFVVDDFFTIENYSKVPDVPKPKIVTAIAMFYDLDDPNKFVADVKTVMDQDGVFIIQMSYLPDMLRTNEFSNICHEHVEFYSLLSLVNLLKLHEMRIVDVELNDINGGSIRAYIRNIYADPKQFGDQTYRTLALNRVAELLNAEKKMRLDELDPYNSFRSYVERIRYDIVGFITDEVTENHSTGIYGASTKGNTLLQYFQLDNNIIDFAADRNPDKWGRVTVGSRIPIISEDEMRKSGIKNLLVLPWHFVSEFKVREKEWLKSGGRFILPAPHFTLI